MGKRDCHTTASFAANRDMGFAANRDMGFAANRDVGFAASIFPKAIFSSSGDGCLGADRRG